MAPLLLFLSRLKMFRNTYSVFMTQISQHYFECIRPIKISNYSRGPVVFEILDEIDAVTETYHIPG